MKIIMYMYIKVNEFKDFKISILFMKFIIFFHKIGKVHGSLARAGKVKGQTPKVLYYN